MGGTVVLYAEAGPGVGMGHVFRLYPLFQRMKSVGMRAEMIVPLPQERLRVLGLEGVREVPGEPDAVERELSRLRPRWAVLDSYVSPNRFSRFLRQTLSCKVVVFDDHYTLEENVDIVINFSLAADVSRYGQNIAETFLMGPDFSPIALSFLEARKSYQVRPAVQNIMVALGGDDVNNNLDRLIKEVLRVACGSVDIELLGSRLPGNSTDGVRAVGWISQEDFGRRTVEYDLAVLAGGSMLHQFACVGVPVISWPQTEMQQGHALAWQEIGSVSILHCLDELHGVMSRMQKSEERGRLSDAGRRSVDGLGAERIVSYLG